MREFIIVLQDLLGDRLVMGLFGLGLLFKLPDQGGVGEEPNSLAPPTNCP